MNSLLHYHKRISDMVDACFDLHVEVPRIEGHALNPPRFPEESSTSLRRRVEKAREAQHQRFAGTPFAVNADLRTINDVERYCHHTATAETLLNAALRQLHLSPRHIVRLHRVARTIADLGESAEVEANHFAEAIQYRSRIELR